jgi:AbrB family looped-hinge helix DNA binding protein
MAFWDEWCGMTERAVLARVTRNGNITLSAAIRRAAGIETGDLVAVTIEGDTITLVRKKLVEKTQNYLWSEAWQRAEREASEDIAHGRARAFNEAGELIAALEAGEA